MPTISKKKLKLVKRLYYNELYSAKQIAKRLCVSIDSVYYFMRRYNMKRRSFEEENKIRFNRKPPSFKFKKELSKYEEILKVIGIILYWSEGYKTEKSSIVDFTNSDPEMINTFVNFLRRICGVKESKLRVFLYCYANQDKDRLIAFWSKVTKIPKKQFSKPYVRNDFKEQQMDKMPHGLVHIRYCDKKLLLQIKQLIEHYKKMFA